MKKIIISNKKYNIQCVKRYGCLETKDIFHMSHCFSGSYEYVIFYYQDEIFLGSKSETEIKKLPEDLISPKTTKVKKIKTSLMDIIKPYIKKEIIDESQKLKFDGLDYVLEQIHKGVRQGGFDDSSRDFTCWVYMYNFTNKLFVIQEKGQKNEPYVCRLIYKQDLQVV